jgi:LAO/AO transport system kinase
VKVCLHGCKYVRDKLIGFVQSGVIIALVSTEEIDSASLQAMIERLQSGDPRALARAISIVENKASGAQMLLAECRRSAGKAIKIGITGPPGAGKSTLVDQMGRWLHQRGEKVGVIAVDPSSPYTGGALLGDRIRMQELTVDFGIYIRSMASRGAVGGITSAMRDVSNVIEAAGREWILIETVGVGQDEVKIASLADLTVVMLVPGLGDDIQSLKAGLMEIADLFVVNKSDCDGAEKVVAEILAMQELSGAKEGKFVPVLQTVATTGSGIADLMAEIVRQKQHAPRDSFEVNWLKKLRLDHLGIAVKDIAESRKFYEMLGLIVQHEETIEHEQVHTAMLPIGESRLELLQPLTADSVIGRFLEKRGEGLHHIAVKVADVDAMFATLQEKEVRLVSDQVRVGAGGHRYFFVHPSSAGGVLIEIVGEKE